MVRGSGGRSFQRCGAVLDNVSAIIMISLAVLLISAKGVGWRPRPIYRDSKKKSAPDCRERRAQSTNKASVSKRMTGAYSFIYIKPMIFKTKGRKPWSSVLANDRVD